MCFSKYFIATTLYIFANCTEQSAIYVKNCSLLSAISYLICIFAPIKNNMDALLIDNP